MIGLAVLFAFPGLRVPSHSASGSSKEFAGGVPGEGQARSTGKP